MWIFDYKYPQLPLNHFVCSPVVNPSSSQSPGCDQHLLDLDALLRALQRICLAAMGGDERKGGVLTDRYRIVTQGKREISPRKKKGRFHLGKREIWAWFHQAKGSFEEGKVSFNLGKLSFHLGKGRFDGPKRRVEWQNSDVRCQWCHSQVFFFKWLSEREKQIVFPGKSLKGPSVLANNPPNFGVSWVQRNVNMLILVACWF